MTWEYVAGFFDGEGCISKVKNRRGDKHSWAIRMDQSFPNQKVIVRIHTFLNQAGLHSNYALRKPQTKRHQPSMVLTIYGSASIIMFLTATLPHLIVKRKKALMCLKQAQVIQDRMQDEKGRIDAAIEAYRKGTCTSINETRHKYKVATKTIAKYLRLRKIKRRSRSEACRLAWKKKLG